MEAHGDQLSGTGDATLKRARFGKVDYDHSWEERRGPEESVIIGTGSFSIWGCFWR
jgi:hypothetical protein